MQRSPARRHALRPGHRKLIAGQRARSGHLRGPQRLHDDPWVAHLHLRHAQRVLQFPQPVHPEPVRQLRVREHRQLRGRIRAGVLAQLLADRPIRSRPAAFKVYQFGLYAGDHGACSPNFTLTYGVRWDKPVFPDTPTANPAAVANYGYQNGHRAVARTAGRRAPDSTGTCPAMGRGQQVRGGLRPLQRPQPVRLPVKPVRQHAASNSAALSLGFNATANNFPFSADPDNQPKSMSATPGRTKSTSSIRTISSRPSLAAIIAYDRDLFVRPGRQRRTALHRIRLNDVNYTNLNLVQTAHAPRRPAGLRPYQHRLQRRHPAPQHRPRQEPDDHQRSSNGASAAAGSRAVRYSYGRTKTRSATRRTARRARPGSMSTPPATSTSRSLAISNFDLRHRVVLSGSYNFDLRKAAGDAVDVLQRPNRPTVLVQLRQRHQRRRRHDQRPLYYPRGGGQRRGRLHLSEPGGLPRGWGLRRRSAGLHLSRATRAGCRSCTPSTSAPRSTCRLGVSGPSSPSTS